MLALIEIIVHQQFHSKSVRIFDVIRAINGFESFQIQRLFRIIYFYRVHSGTDPTVLFFSRLLLCQVIVHDVYSNHGDRFWFLPWHFLIFNFVGWRQQASACLMHIGFYSWSASLLFCESWVLLITQLSHCNATLCTFRSKKLCLPCR